MKTAKKPAAPAANASNKQVRAFALGRMKQRYPRLVTIALLAYIPTIIMIAPRLYIAESVWISAASFIIALLFTPMSIGIAFYFYSIYLNDGAELKAVFRFYRESRLLVISLLLGLIQQLLMLLMLIPDYILRAIPPYADYKLATLYTSALSAVLLPVCCFLLLRQFLTGYIFGRNTDKGAGQIIKESLTYTKKKVHNILWFMITIMWVPVLLVIALAVICTSVLGRFVADSTVKTVVNYIIVMPPFLLFMPYVYLSLAGYAHTLLANNRALKK